MSNSLNRAAQLRAAVELPQITYPAELPVSAHREEISRAIAENQVVIIAGETGSGKTTQIPKIVLELGRGRAGQIGHTQPRRLAARSVASRIAEELGTELGGIIGFQVRFTDTSSDETLVRVMTDGILLAQIQRDPQLLAYDTIIIDEAHERSLNIDFLLGYLTQLLPKRPDLKLIITSATIDSARFAEHYQKALGTPVPVLEVSGRTYPVEVRYQPLVNDEGKGVDQFAGICQAAAELIKAGPGDILVFLSGQREIDDAADALREHFGAARFAPKSPDQIEILPLYARLSAAEQHLVFQPHQTRRIVLATNVAETSITVPGIRYVIDPGTARISRYAKNTRIQRLPIEPVSQASANQRAGRCGRIGPGIAIRLYSEDDFAARPEFTEPEILRTSLAAVILQMIASGVVSTPAEVAAFPFIQSPDTRAVHDGVGLLAELSALRVGGNRPGLTQIGRRLARLPLDPRLGRMMLEAARLGVTSELIIIAAALTIADPRERPVEQREAADLAHGRFVDGQSDFLTYLNLWHYLREQRYELSGSAFRRLCRREFLNFMRVREWQDLVNQLRDIAKEMGLPLNKQHARTGDGTWDYRPIHQAILTGSLSLIGMQQTTEVRKGGPKQKPVGRKRRGPAEFLGPRGVQFAVFPGSALATRPPAWLVAGEIVQTSRTWARQVAWIDPEWIEQLAGHLVVRSFSEPLWSIRRGAAMARERVSLYGLPIVVDRPVLLSKVDGELAHEMFLRNALVEGQWHARHEFMKHNAQVRAEAESRLAKHRASFNLADDDALVQFFAARVPASVVSAAHFDSWWKKARHDDPELLNIPLQVFIPDTELLDTANFPESWPQGNLDLRVSYHHDPGELTDGIVVHVPLELLPQVQPAGFEWLVPGRRAELVTALLRGLAKPLRVQLVPIPDLVPLVVGWLTANTADWVDTVRAADAAPTLAELLSRAVQELRQVTVAPEDWNFAKLPDHLRVTFQIEEYRGGSVAVLDRGTDLRALKIKHAERAGQQVRMMVRGAVGQALQEARESAGAGAPPEKVTQKTARGLEVEAYPGLGGDGKQVRVYTSPEERDHASRAALLERLVRECGLEVKRISSRWTGSQALALAGAPHRNTAELVGDLQRAAVASLLSRAPGAGWQARSDKEIAEVAGFVRAELEDEVNRLAGLLVPVFTKWTQLQAGLGDLRGLTTLELGADLKKWAAVLIYPGFIAEAWAQLDHFDRYLRAGLARLESAPAAPQRDTAALWQFRESEKLVLELAAHLEAGDRVTALRAADALTELRWMLEEFRVSLFAQRVGTAYPVSAKRIAKAVAAVGA